MSRLAAFFLVFASAMILDIAIASAGQNDQEGYLSDLISTAQMQRLSEQRYWHLLLHYKRMIYGSYESEEDGPDFFNSPAGKTNPEAELIATLTSFFASPDDLEPGKEHPQCVFPARYKWLKSRLEFDPSRLPEQRCDRLDNWLAEVNPSRITLVFASSYLNNPASMFGHTFLRIDKKREGPQQKLLDYGVNYAANPDTGNPLIYTYKGLIGGFKGTFSVFPYYVKVQEYNNLESRDLWEYELNFNDDQMNYFMLHLWELGGNYFDYYYFQENCSYQILSLLEVADPNLHLTDAFVFQVIPGDTVKELTRYPGLISREVYRPSLLSQMNEKRIRMSDHETALFYQLVDDPNVIEKDEFLELRVPEKVMILDAYLDYAQYRDLKRTNSATAIDPTTRRILLVRSQLDYRGDAQEAIRFSSPPELGHGSARVGLGFGRNGQEMYEEFSIRPAYHDLLADDDGYAKGSQILFLDLTARYYNETQKTKIDSFKIIDIVSLAPYDPLFKKKSWALSFNLENLRDLDCGYCDSFNNKYGLGLSYRPDYFSPFLFYGLANVELQLSSHLDRDYRLGGGGTVGALLDVLPRWRFQVTGNYMSFPLGNESHFYKVEASPRFAVSQNLDIRANWNVVNSRQEWSFGLNYYF